MIDKKKLKDVMKKQDLKQEKPTDPSMTLDVKNEDVEAQIECPDRADANQTCACSGKFK